MKKKQPFLNYYSIPGGKVEYGELMQDAVAREFEEETGIVVKNHKLKLIAEKITIDDETNDIIHHMIGYYYTTKDFEGELIIDTREGINHWISFEDFKKEKRFEELDFLILDILKSEKIKLYTLKRYAKDKDVKKMSL